jgi:hypothetical protein
LNQQAWRKLGGEEQAELLGLGVVQVKEKEGSVRVGVVRFTPNKVVPVQRLLK